MVVEARARGNSRSFRSTMRAVIAIILTGAPGAGKSTVAAMLAARLERAAHVPIDFFRKMVKGGYASPHHWNDEVARQYRIARKSAAQTAINLAAGGFVPILDDIVPADWVDEWRRGLGGPDFRFGGLRPALPGGLRRNQGGEARPGGPR